jgi:hypothetical protein
MDEYVGSSTMLDALFLTLPCSRIDVSPEFSFDHMLEFSKLAVAFAIELGGWEKV